MQRILVIEDDEAVKRELEALLEKNGYTPVVSPPCELALLDVNLPREDGFALCRRLKAEGGFPVIFLTARDAAEDELRGFLSGGDDYIKKPYNPAVLLARISRLLKHGDGRVTVNGLTLDSLSFTVYYGGNNAVLTKTELRIMQTLMERGSCTRTELIEQLWTDSCYIDENTLYVNIARLREKLREIGAADFIKTVRGVGYSI